MNSFVYLLGFIIAVLYSSAGFGGASGYLVAMNFFGVPANVMSSTALVLNIFVSSTPAAFIGGTINLSEQTYTTLLYIVLTYLAVRMVLFPTLTEKLN